MTTFTVIGRRRIFVELLVLTAVLGGTDSAAETDTIGIGAEVSSLRRTIDDASDRIERADQSRELKAVKLHYATRDIRKLLYRLAKRMRRAERNRGDRDEIARISAFIDDFGELNADLETAKSDGDLDAARRTLRMMAAAVTSIEIEVFGLESFRDVAGTETAAPNRFQGANDNADSQSSGLGTATLPDLVISKVEVRRFPGLLTATALAIVPYVRNMTAGHTNAPIQFLIKRGDTHKCQIVGGIGPYEIKRPDNTCATLYEELNWPFMKMMFGIKVDESSSISETDEDNNICVVTYTPPRGEKGTYKCEIVMPRNNP